MKHIKSSSLNTSLGMATQQPPTSHRAIFLGNSDYMRKTLALEQNNGFSNISIVNNLQHIQNSSRPSRHIRSKNLSTSSSTVKSDSPSVFRPWLDRETA